MSKFSCPVVRVASVTEHPNADRLSVVKLEGLGYNYISAKLADGSPNYLLRKAAKGADVTEYT